MGKKISEPETGSLMLRDMAISFDGLFFDGLKTGSHLLHVLPLKCHGWVNISAQRNVYGGMTKNCTEAFHIKPLLDPFRREGVSQGVKLYILDVALSQHGLETVEHGAGLHMPICLAGQKDCPGSLFCREAGADPFRQGNRPHGMFAFR